MHPLFDLALKFGPTLINAAFKEDDEFGEKKFSKKQTKKTSVLGALIILATSLGYLSADNTECAIDIVEDIQEQVTE